MDSLPGSDGLGDVDLYRQDRHPSRSKKNLLRQSRRHVVRATAKRLAKTSNPNICHDLNLPCTRGDCVTANRDSPDSRRRHFEQDVDYLTREHALFQRWASTCSCCKLWDTGKPRGGWVLNRSDEKEGEALARDSVPLPSDHFRRPSLERQDAFRDASTSRGNVRICRRDPYIATEDADVAELYAMGLLYDDEQDRGEEMLTLNTITHSEPVYSIRPARRRGRGKNRSRSYSSLHLNLSFTDLGGDEAIAQFLTPAPSTLDDAAIDTHTGRSFAPLRVIYELDGSNPSFDIDTSQTPDLVSDYDCLSDSDLDDLPVREVRDGAASSPADAWIVLGNDS